MNNAADPEIIMVEKKVRDKFVLLNFKKLKLVHLASVTAKKTFAHLVYNNAAIEVKNYRSYLSNYSGVYVSKKFFLVYHK
jgi:hypothetical protein